VSLADIAIVALFIAPAAIAAVWCVIAAIQVVADFVTEERSDQ
jgi:hypothetical protein